MASKPGILTDWPWTCLGNFKYLVLAPWAIQETYSFVVSDESERDLSHFLIFPFLLLRMLHSQIWISLSRYHTAKGSNRIVDKTIEFEQVDRERNWDDQIIFNGLLLYLGGMYVKGGDHLPLWRTDGIVLTALLHAGPVEFLYYWLHRALHHHFLYSRYHSHHHSSIATEPITSVIHPFAEHIAYFVLFAIPLYTSVATGTASILSMAIYVIYIDFMNNMGHCNFELIPKWLLSAFPPLKYLMYTPSFHSLHHTQFRTNYSLFMPFYDYIYGTMDESSDSLYEIVLDRKEDTPDVVHLTHLTTPESIYYMRLGFASLASKPHNSTWYLWLLWPVTLWSMMVTRIYGRTFTIERNVFKHLKLQTWAVPKYKIQYYMQWQRESINNLIEDAILAAEEKGVKVLSLGLLNQQEELNGVGELFVRRHPKLKVKLISGTSLAVAVVLNSVPKGTSQVVLRGNLSKVAYSIALALCQGGIQVTTLREDEYNKLKARLSIEAGKKLVLSKIIASKTWIVGDGLSEDEQLRAPKGTVFIPYSQFPPKKIRKDCFYYNIPAMLAPKHFQNVDSCENWLPRRVMSAWRIAGILHALEDWNVHECGNVMFDIDKIWQASLEHGFTPIMMSTDSKLH
ncbi:protein ECERIFERUM 1-like isoform X1 [Olea europaea var. sylvestris]|uniref:protein ECERIFERUM 1-like isoform X1 n=1 Tax=Olea europaea var. sylvestris TaxID=158386 RepID=UPI000C1D8843|nr:protein ECERIFERUM 1-like isoform X1 [Olea europaea var. sylvestris]